MNPSKGNSPYAIRVRDLTKVFRLYHSPLDLVRERLTGKKRHTEYVALDHVSFDIRHGETVGIIGRNGAGKSTLLKIIAGVLDHDSGTVEVDGRVSALLELGSGFNPEYTGRENILFGGMCLGMSRAEILEKMDSIIAFAELEEYIDQPLKTYSSGMHSRLAFATAIAVDAEVLIVDEALAVGDMFFQAKCMAHMRKMQQRGTTILFVSHSPESVKQMCDRGILLEHGKILLDSDTLQVTERYFNVQLRKQKTEIRTDHEAPEYLAPPAQAEDTSRRTTLKPVLDLHPSPEDGLDEFQRRASFERVQDGSASFYNIQLLDAEGRIRNSFQFGEKATLRMIVDAHKTMPTPMFGYAIQTLKGVGAVWSDTRTYEINLEKLEAGRRYVIDWQFQMNLQHGDYQFRCSIAMPPKDESRNWQYIDIIPRINNFSVLIRREAPVGEGFVVWDNNLSIAQLA